MGINDRADDAKAGRRAKKRGSTDNGGRLAGLQSPAQAKGTAEWSGASAEYLLGVVALATSLGFIVSFSLSRDGGAHGFSLYGDGERVQLWFNGDADLDAELEKVYAYLDTLR